MVLDVLDEAASDRDRRLIGEALADLAVLPGLRVAVATRPLAVRNPYAPGGLLAALGVITRDDHNLVDLDSNAYFDLGGLRQFAAALLAQDGMDHPGPEGRAWTRYRTQPAVRDGLAAVIAERAGRNFLVASMAADRLSAAPKMIDPAAGGFDPADIESGVGEALGKYLGQLPEERRERCGRCSRRSATPGAPGWMTRTGSPSPTPWATPPRSSTLIPSAARVRRTICSRPRRPSAALVR